MGFRAHVYTKKIVETSSDGYFNWEQDGLNDFLCSLREEIDYDGDDPLYTEDGYGEILNEWEIEKNFLEEAIEFMKKKKPNDIAFCDYTYAEVIKIFKSWLKDSENEENFSYPYYIYLSWF